MPLRFLMLFCGLGGLMTSECAAQIVLYREDFGPAAMAPFLPPEWSANSAQIFTSAQVPSGGYAGASGGCNLLARNCDPAWEERIFEVSRIATTGYTGISIAFSHRITSCFIPPVGLEWSADAIHWETVPGYALPPLALTWIPVGPFYLPSGAENQEELFLRWIFYPEAAQGCSFHCNDFAGNYRLDDLVVMASSPLPVEWLYVDAHRNGEYVSMRWATAAESNSDFFEVERSLDGRTFRACGRLPARGFSQEVTHYSWFDEQAFALAAYYRLRQVDLDGAVAYSRVCFLEADPTAPSGWSLRADGGRILSLHPGHAIGGRVCVEAYTPDGRQWQSDCRDEPSWPWVLDLSDKPPGVVLVVVRDVRGVVALRWSG